MSEEKNNNNGIGVFGLTFIVFLFLKLGEIGAVAEWSWWQVTAPLWGGLIIKFISIMFLVVIQSRKNRFFRRENPTNPLLPTVDVGEIPTPKQIEKYRSGKTSFKARIKSWIKKII